MRFYAAGFDGGIFGIGATEEDAIADAAAELRGGCVGDGDCGDADCDHECPETWQMTAAAHAAVKRDGYDCGRGHNSVIWYAAGRCWITRRAAERIVGDESLEALSY